MTSMRKLRRRLLRWQRYADRVAFNPRINQPWAWQPPHGFQRAAKAAWEEQERRKIRADWPTDPRCCLSGDEGHDGPCVVRCDGCAGNGGCPECGGLDDLGCWHCDGTGGCPHGCDDGEIVLELL